MRRASDTLAGVLAWHASERSDAPWLLFEDEKHLIRSGAEQSAGSRPS